MNTNRIQSLGDLIDRYDAMVQAAYYAMRDNPALLGEYVSLYHAISPSDITGFDVDDKGLFCSGMAFTNTTGGSFEHFEFRVPWESLPEDVA